MNRRLVLFGVSLFVLLGSLTAAAATLVDRDYELRGYVDATQDQNLPFRLPRLGVNAELTQYDDAELAHQLDLMQQAHVTWIRQFVYWDAVEAQPGAYDWRPWDRIVAAIDHYPSLQLVIVLMNSPQWARSGSSATAPPDDPADFGHFAGDFARRFGASINYYQIWDEPNLRAAWGGSNPRASQYVAMLQSAYHEIHSADPLATVIAAALAPTVEQGPQNISDWRYLDDLYALGAAGFMDAAAAKPYGFSKSPLDRTVAEDVLDFSRIVSMREIMVQHGDGKKALWASNWGWNSLPADWSGPASIWGGVDAESQVNYTLQALDRAEREWPWLGGMLLQHWQPDAPPDDPVWGFAAIDQNDEPTALWQALVNRPQASAATDGLYPAANAFAHYSGVWTFGDLGADIGWINDSALDFDFAGRDLALLLRQDDYVAYLYPTIDGQPANAPPLDVAGHAYIVLTSDTRLPTLGLVSVARDLATGQHKLHVVADDLVPDEAQARWALAGYAVSSGDLRAPYDRQIAIALVAVLIGLIATTMTGLQVLWATVVPPVTAVWQNLSDAGQLALGAVTSLALMLGMLLTWSSSTPLFFRRDPVQLGLAILTAGIIYLQPGLILALFSLAVLFVIVYHRLDLGLALTIFWAPFFLFPLKLFQFAFPMSETIILVTTIGWLLRLLRDWGRLRQSANSTYPVIPFWARLNVLDWAVLAWVLMGIISLIWAEYHAQALTELRTIILEPALFYAIIRSSVSQRRSQILLVDALLLAGMAVSLIGLMLFFRGQAVITAEDGVRRLASVYGSPNNLGLFVGKCIPLALAFLTWHVDQRRRVFAGFGLAIMGVAVILSQSAGALFIGVPVSVVAVLLLMWRRRVLLPLTGLAVASGLGLIFALRSARFARLLDFSSGTNFARLRVWHSALNMIKDHPLTGLGLDQFLYAFRGAYITPDAWQEPDLSHPHNIVLDFWLRLSIVGLLILIWLQTAFWIKALQNYRRFRDSDALFFALTVGLMGSMINLLSHGLVDNSVFVNDLAFVFMLLLALANNLTNVRAIDAEID